MLFVFAITFFAFENSEAATSVSPKELLEDYQPPRWEKLGVRKVNYRLDRDEIMVTARQGRFSKLRIKVEKGGVNLHRIVVHYRSGTTQTVNVNQSIPAGTLSRALDLPGNKRIITKVVFFYDTKNFSSRRARVELWGKR